MPGIFDALQGMMGNPDPSAQLYAALGQAPGGPGSPAGAQPGAGGAGASPQGGGSPGGTQQQQPQVYQSSPDLAQAYMALSRGGQAPSQASAPPDLARMYMAAQQRDQASNQFYSGLGLLAAGMYPGRNPNASMKWAQENQRDPSSLFQNLVQLQQYSQQNQALQAYRQGIPKMLTDAGISQDYAPLVAANPNLLGDILKSRMGLTGDPGERALQAARNDWFMRNPGKTESDMIQAHPEYSDPISFAATKTGQATTASSIAKDQATDRDAAQKTLPSLVTSTGDMLTNLDKIIGASDDDLGNYVGGPIAAMKPLTGAGASMTSNPELAASLDQVVKQTFGEGFREVAGKTSRVTNTEATSLSGSLSQLQNRGLDPAAFRSQAQIVKDRLLHTLGTAYGEAGQSDNLPDYLTGKDGAGNPYVDPEYSPKGGARYWRSGGTAPPGKYPGLSSAAPAASSAPPVPNAQKASDGNWYVPDPARPGKYLRVD